MRKRVEIEEDGTRKDILTLEVLLDIRDLLFKERKKQREVEHGKGRARKIGK